MNFNDLYLRKQQEDNELMSGNSYNSGNREESRQRYSQHSNFHRSDTFEVKRKWKSLNKQFQRDILRLERSLGGMETREKSLASEWVNKLKAHPPNLNEALARNYILAYLLRFNNLKIFNWKPFNNPSVLSTLSKLSAIMPMMSFKRKSVIELINNSTDNGDFIFKLPVPRDGAFFIVHLSPNLSNSESTNLKM